MVRKSNQIKVRLLQRERHIYGRTITEKVSGAL